MRQRGIADYEFVDHLGAGNHGEFWLAKAPERLGLPSGTLVAVKTLGQRATDAEFRRMSNELKIYVTVESPFLCPVLDAGQQDGRLYYTTPYFIDGSLESPARPLERATVRQIVSDSARAAHHLHQAGIAHRDIKPSNMMILESRGRLADLGLAQILHPGQTVTGIGPVGTIEYLAPEVVEGASATRASDIWSLGVSLHRALSGRSVYPELAAGSLLEALRRVVTDRPEIDTGLPAEEQTIIARCLASAPGDRFATADAFAEALDAVRDPQEAP